MVIKLTVTHNSLVQTTPRVRFFKRTHTIYIYIYIYVTTLTKIVSQSEECTYMTITIF